MDAAAVFDFDMERLKGSVGKLNPDMPVFPVSSLKGDGYDEWIAWLKEEIKKWQE